jgi:hypothetical protein
MHTAWFKGHKDKEARTKEIMGYRNAFDALTEILEQEFKKKDAVRDYGPGWAEQQIAVNEYNYAIDRILDLINVNKESK